MIRRARGWLDHTQALGHAGLELLRSEAAAVRAEIAATSRGLLVALGLLLAALFLVFWALGALAYAALEALALGLPRWGAALVLFAILVLAILVLALLGRRRLRRLETPAATLRRRLDDHREWWRRSVGGPPLRAGRDDAGDGDDWDSAAGR